MVTLKDLEKDFYDIEAEIETLIKKQQDNKKALEAIGTDLETVQKEKTAAEQEMKVYDEKKKKITDPKQKNACDILYQAAEAEFKKYSDLEKQILELTDSVSIEKLEELRDRQDQIIIDLASDKRVYIHLRELIIDKFDDSRRAHTSNVENLEKISESLKLALKDKKSLGKEVEKLVKAFDKKEAIDKYSTQNSVRAKREKAEKEYADAVKAFKAAIKSKPEFAKVPIRDKDIKAIIEASRTPDGEYKLPSIEREIAKSKKIVENMDSEENKLIAKLDEIRENGFGIADPEALRDIEKKLNDVQKEMLNKGQERNETTSKVKTLKDLRTKAGVKPEDEKEFNEANEEYNKALEELKAVGYISATTHPDLKDKDSELSKLYAIFVEADKAVREAFLECKTSSADDKTKEDALKDNLKQKIEAYQKAAADLNAKSGMKTEDWNKYLLRELEAKSRAGEEIDQVYFDSTITKRYEALGEEYLDHDGVEEKYKLVGEKLELLAKDQEAVLTGKTFDVNEIFKNVDGYREGMKEIADAVGVKVADVFAIMKTNVIQTVKGIWGKFKNGVKNLFNRVFNSKETFESNVEYDNLDKLQENLEKARRRKEAAENKRDDNISGKLTEDEIAKLEELEKENPEAKLATIEAEYADLESKETALKEEKEKLSKTSSVARKIEDGKRIAVSEYGGKFSKDVLQKIEERDDR